MSRSRTLLAIVGIAATGMGVAIAISPGLAATVSVPTIPISALGAISLVFAAGVALRRRDATVRGAEPSEVEKVVEHPRPGDSFDTAIRSASGIGIDAARHRREGREHLADVAIDVLVLTEGYTEAEADAALAEGTWTDDPVAAACFAAEPPSPGLGGVLSRYVDRRSQYERELVHAIDALDALLSGEGRP